MSEQQTLGDEYVERKGIGHPDTLADLIAEECSNEYSKYCIHAFGGILNHWFDKVVLSGGVAELAFGIKKINKPITAYLFGKAVTSFNGKEIPIEKLFKKTCEKILKDVFQNDEVLKHVRYVVDINDGIGFDHEKSFYFPKKKKDLITLESYKSNDTVMCSGYAPYSVAEKVTIDIENFINSKKYLVLRVLMLRLWLCEVEIHLILHFVFRL